MANFLSKTFGKLTSSILNLIVIALSVISVISLIALPVLNLKVGVTFTKEISEIHNAIVNDSATYVLKYSAKTERK